MSRSRSRNSRGTGPQKDAAREEMMNFLRALSDRMDEIFESLDSRIGDLGARVTAVDSGLAERIGEVERRTTGSQVLGAQVLAIGTGDNGTAASLVDGGANSSTSLQGVPTAATSAANEVSLQPDNEYSRNDIGAVSSASRPTPVESNAVSVNAPTIVVPAFATSSFSAKLRPSFDGKDKVHVLDFVEDLDNYLAACGVPEKTKVTVAMQCLQGAAKELAKSFPRNYSYTEFTECLVEEYWGEERQRDFERQLHSTKFQWSTDCSMKEHFLQFLNRARRLQPAKTDKEIIQAIIRHYPDAEENMLLAADVQDVAKMKRLLERLDTKAAQRAEEEKRTAAARIPVQKGHQKTTTVAVMQGDTKRPPAAGQGQKTQEGNKRPWKKRPQRSTREEQQQDGNQQSSPSTSSNGDCSAPPPPPSTQQVAAMSNPPTTLQGNNASSSSQGN
jgi:hypothetical protein